MKAKIKDPYRAPQQRLQELQTKLRSGGKLRPAIDCVLEIKGFIENWDRADGELDDAIAVFARRQNVSCQPSKMTKTLVNALVFGASERHDRISTEWAHALNALTRVPCGSARAAIVAEGGIDKIAKKKSVSPKYAYLAGKALREAQAKPSRE